MDPSEYGDTSRPWNLDPLDPLESTLLSKDGVPDGEVIGSSRRNCTVLKDRSPVLVFDIRTSDLSL